MNKSTARRALGRGLTNLIPVDSEERGSGSDVVEIAVDAILANPFQPRTEFNEAEIAGLAQSIEQQGLLQPLVVRKKVGGYEIISGERRFRALKKIGRDTIPCIVRPKVSDREMLELALVENIQRENLNEIDAAHAYQRLQLECNLSADDLAARVGKSRSAVANTIRLLKLPADIQQMVRSGKMTMGHARALLAVESEDRQHDVARRILDEKLSVREVEAAVLAMKSSPKKAASGTTTAAQPKEADPDTARLIEQLRYRFGTPVKIVHAGSAAGKVEIIFHGKEDLDRVIELLLGH